MLSSRNQRRTRARCILVIETYLSSRDLNNTAQLPAGPYRNLGNVRCSDFWHGKHPPRSMISSTRGCVNSTNRRAHEQLRSDNYLQDVVVVVRASRLRCFSSCPGLEHSSMARLSSLYRYLRGYIHTEKSPECSLYYRQELWTSKVKKKLCNRFLLSRAISVSRGDRASPQREKNVNGLVT